MLDGPAHRHFNKIAAKWRDLAEKRRQYFVELHSSGRWRHYYKSEAQFLLRMRAAAMLAEGWEILIPYDEQAAPAAKPAAPAAPVVPSRRQSAA
jgi:uncharacterized repeat protein (TIGR03809 family)